MKALAFLCLAIATAARADTIEVFGHKWTVLDAADWKVGREGTAQVLRLLQAKGPLPPPAPRRPRQFAIAQTPMWERVTVDAEVKPLGRSLIVVFAWRDDAHFNYAHISTDTKTHVHNGIFHVYGGERVRISPQREPPAFPGNNKWYRVRLTHDASTGIVAATVDGREIPALNAVDLSLGPGRIGLGSFDETAEFRNVKIGGTPAQTSRSASQAEPPMPVATEQPR
ncbi:MAG TPA: hypothetical protein VFL57_22490 [Bryobacteraceae bacterium]|nr:hypothetical protein [Bryobacteraceae bacterium]